MSPTHHHQQQRRNSVNANSDTSTDGPWQCSTPLVRICTVGTINNVAGKDPQGKIPRERPPGKDPMERSCGIFTAQRPYVVFPSSTAWYIIVQGRTLNCIFKLPFFRTLLTVHTVLVSTCLSSLRIPRSEKYGESKYFSELRFT